MRTLIVITFGLVTCAFLTCSCATVPQERLTDKQITAREDQQSIWSKLGQSAAKIFLNLGVNYIAGDRNFDRIDDGLKK